MDIIVVHFTNDNESHHFKRFSAIWRWRNRYLPWFRPYYNYFLITAKKTEIKITPSLMSNIPGFYYPLISKGEGCRIGHHKMQFELLLLSGVQEAIIKSGPRKC